MEEFGKAGVKISSICACGGIAEKDAFLMQLYADITGREIKVTPAKQTAALGAAMYASAAAGRERGGHKNITDAACAMSDSGQQQQAAVYKPEESNAATYNTLYKKYTEVSEFFGTSNDVMHVLKQQFR